MYDVFIDAVWLYVDGSNIWLARVIIRITCIPSPCIKHMISLQKKTLCDSLFLSLDLAKKLLNLDTYITGTLRANRQMPLTINKRPMGHIAHLRKQFKSINTYDYIIKLINRRKKTLLTLWEFIGSSFEQTWIPFTQGCFVPSLVEIGSVVLEKKIFKFRQSFFAIS